MLCQPPQRARPHTHALTLCGGGRARSYPPRWVWSFEAALDEIWDRFQRGEAPADTFPPDRDDAALLSVRGCDPSAGKVWVEKKGDRTGLVLAPRADDGPLLST